MSDLELRKKRIRYRSWHRGCKETDILLGHFCDQYVEAMDDETLTHFEAVLDEEDANLFRWLTGEQPIPARLSANPILTRLLSFEVAPLLPAKS